MNKSEVCQCIYNDISINTQGDNKRNLSIKDRIVNQTMQQNSGVRQSDNGPEEAAITLMDQKPKVFKMNEIKQEGQKLPVPGLDLSNLKHVKEYTSQTSVTLDNAEPSISPDKKQKLSSA